MNQSSAKWIIAIGVLLVIGGMVFYYFGDKLKWIGNLPGDIKIKKENFSFYFPITTMVLLSILINIIFRVINALK